MKKIINNSLILLGMFIMFDSFAQAPGSTEPTHKKVRQAPSVEPVHFVVDPSHTYFQFIASTLLFDVSGQFHKYDVKLTGNPETLANASIELRIDPSSVDTSEKDRDNHLRSEDFFGVQKYPSIVFTSSDIKRQGMKLIVRGKLTMHGVTKELTIPFDVIKGENAAGVIENVYRADLSIRRKDFGIGVDSLAAKISLKDEVQIHVLLAGFFRPVS